MIGDGHLQRSGRRIGSRGRLAECERRSGDSRRACRQHQRHDAAPVHLHPISPLNSRTDAFNFFDWIFLQSMSQLIHKCIELASMVLRGEAVKDPEEHTSELQSLMRISYADFCLKKKNNQTTHVYT